VVHILSLEISVRDMTRPAGFSSDEQYLVRETDDERASEISNEFYPEDSRLAGERVDSPERAQEQDEQSARICELATRLGYREVKTRMLLGQWARNLAGLERKLLDELDQQIGKMPPPTKGGAITPSKRLLIQMKNRLPLKVFRSESSHCRMARNKNLTRPS